MIEIPGIGHFAAVLFDNDGVLVDSTGHVDECWGLMCDRHGLDRSAVLADFHGRPALETLSRFLEGERLEAAFADLLDLEIEASARTAAMPGALEIISVLNKLPCAHTIATSATSELARVRLRAAGVPVPSTMVTIDDVRRGKPAPDPYLLAAERLGVPAERCLVVEDAPSGIRAGRAAGATVVAVATTHHRHELAEAHHVVAGLPELLGRIGAAPTP